MMWLDSYILILWCQSQYIFFRRLISSLILIFFETIDRVNVCHFWDNLPLTKSIQKPQNLTREFWFVYFLSHVYISFCSAFTNCFDIFVGSFREISSTNSFQKVSKELWSESWDKAVYTQFILSLAFLFSYLFLPIPKLLSSDKSCLLLIHCIIS